MARLLTPSNIIVAVLAILILGRYIGVPIALIIAFGYSMAPTLSPGDLVIIYTSDFEEGDIVLWCNELLSCRLHRVIKIWDGLVQTKGDANDVPDPPVPREWVRYRMLFYVK